MEKEQLNNIQQFNIEDQDLKLATIHSSIDKQKSTKMEKRE